MATYNRVSTVRSFGKKALQADVNKKKKEMDEDSTRKWVQYLSTLPAQQQEATRQQLAQRMENPGNLRPATPSLRDMRYDVARAQLINNREQESKNRTLGLYDTEAVAYNPDTAHLPSDSYMKKLQESLSMQLASSRVQDDFHRAQEERLSPWEDWYYNMEGEPDDYDLKAMDTLLTGKEYPSWYELTADERTKLMGDYTRMKAQVEGDMAQATPYQSQTPMLQAKYDLLAQEQERRSKSAAYQEMATNLRSSLAFEQDSQYTVDHEFGSSEYEGYMGAMRAWGWSAQNLGEAFSALNKPLGAENAAEVMEEAFTFTATPQELFDFVISPDNYTGNEWLRNRGLHTLTDSEKAEAAAAMAQGEETFTKWLAALEQTGELTRRNAELDRAVQENLAENPATAAPMWVGARIANMASTMNAPWQAISALSGNTDPNSPLFASNNFSRNVSSVQAQAAGELLPWQVPFTDQKFGEFLYNGVSSITDMGVALGVGGLTKAPAQITQLIMSSQAASNALHSALEEDMNPTEAVVRSIIAGGIEALTEKYSIEAILADPTSIAAFIGKNLLTEGSEEGASFVLDTVADSFVSSLYGHETELVKQYEALRAQEVSEKEASQQVLEGWLRGLSGDVLLGGLTGGAMGSVVGAQTSARRSAVGKEVSNLGNVSKLVDIGLTMDVNGESNPLARTIKQAEESGKKVSKRQVGRLYETMYRELDEQSRAVVTDTMRDAVAERMVELGDSPEVAQEAADAVLAVVRNEKPSLGQRQSMARAQSSTQVIKEIVLADDTTSDGRVRHSEWVRTADEKANAAGAASLRKMGELRQTRVGKEATDQAIQRATVNAQQMVAKKATDKKSMDVELEDGQSAEILQVSNAEGEAKVTIKGADGKKQTVSASDLRIKSRPVAAIVSYLDTTSERMSDEQANLLLHSYTGGDAAEHIADFNDAYAAGFMARELPPSKRMDRRMAQQIAEQGRKDAEAAEQKRQATIGAIATGRRGAVTFTENMADAGSEKALKAVSGRLSDTQKKSVAAIKQLARATGVNFVFFESQADDTGRYTAENGHYDVKTGTIYLDLNSGKNSTTDLAEYAILRTAGHELTHFMEHSSKEGYAALRDFVTTELTRRGEDFDALVVKKMDNAARSGAPLTRAGAISEVVADASELMLRDTKAIERLAQKDQGLMAKIKGFIQSFVQKVRDAFSGVDAVHEEARVMMQELAEEFQQKWDFALEEAVEQAREGAVEAEPVAEAQEQFEMREPVEQRKDGLMAVHNLSATKLMDTLRLGGFPMPSIAIIKAKQGHDMYGSYSVVFGPQTIDPKADKANRVYGNDAWTPTFPRVERAIDSDALYDVEMEIQDTAAKVDDEMARKSRAFFGNFGGTDVTDKTDDDIAHSAWNYDGILAAYLIERGETVEMLTKEVDAERPYNVKRADEYDRILDIVDVLDYANMPMHELLDKYSNQLSEVSWSLRRLSAYWATGDRHAGAAMARVIKEAIEYEGSGRDVSEKKTQVKDYQATRQAMEDRIDRSSFDAWITGKLAGSFGQQGIYNGKDRFTRSGNRKIFKQTHYDYTVENVVRAMLQEAESAIPATNASGLKAAASTRYGSIEEIRADSYRLGKVSDEQFNAMMAKADNDLHDFLNAIEAWDYDVQEDAGNLLVTAAKRKLNAKGISDLFKANGFKKATLNAARIAESVIRQVQTIPTGYLEAKPARVVSFDEVRMVVAPESIPPELATALEERGIPYTTYSEADGDRLAKLNAVEDAQFSLRNVQHDDQVLNENMEAVRTMSPIMSLNGDEFDMGDDLTKNVVNYFNKIGGKAYSPLFGWIALTRRGVKDSLGHGMGPVKAFMYTAVPDTIRKGKMIDYQENWKGRGYDTAVIAAPISVSKGQYEGEYYLGVIVNLYPDNSQRYYVHEAVLIQKKSDLVVQTGTLESALHGNKDHSLISILNKLNDVNGKNLKQSSLRDMPTDLTRKYVANLTASDALNDVEKDAIRIYSREVGLLRAAQEKLDQVIAERDAQPEDKQKMYAQRVRDLRQMVSRHYDRLTQLEKTKGVAPLIQRSREYVQEYVQGKTAQDVENLIASTEQEVERLNKLIQAGNKDLVKERDRRINDLRQLRNQATQKLLDEQTRYRQMIATDREVRKLTQQARQMQEKITTRVRKLDKLRRQETDYKNIPEAFKPAVDTLVSMFTDNFGTMVFDKQRADRLSAIYHKLLTVDGNDPMATLTPYYDPDVEADLEALAEWAEKDAQLRTTSGTRMEKAALRLAINKGILEAVDHITAIVTNAQNLFYAGKKAKFDAIGTQMGDALKARQDKKTLRGAAGQALTVMDNLLRTGNMTPVYFFEQLGNEVLSTLWDDIRQGQNAYAFAMRDGRETIQGLQQLYHYWDWADSKRKDNVLEITTEKGRKLTFTREQALWVYATWKREQSNEIAATKHLTEGGIVYEGKKQEGGKVVTTVQSTPAVLSEGDIGRITGWLTDEQKAYADGMVKYLSEDMADLGNRASMEMFGIRKYTESYYFPYRTAGDQLYQSSASGRLDTTSDSRLKHASFTHALTKGASAPLVMGDFSAAVEDHIAHMATYASFVLPIESMNRVLNYKVTLEDDSRATVRSLIEQKYGESAKKYIATLLTDLNGGVRNDNRASGTDYLVRMYKKGAVAASLSTALQQPTSLFRAMAMISPKYIAASTFSKRDWDELTRYSGVAVIKEMGRFDTDVGRSNIDWLHKKHPRGFMERLDAASGFLPEQLDRLTWAHLWSAVKKEQADLHPEMDKQGEAFLTLCGERFNDIVDHTQVYDSILSRSQLMRGKDAMSKMTTSFMAEPTLAINMLYNAAVGITKPGGKVKAAKVMAAVLTSNIAAAAMAALIHAWNDDDDKRSAQTKYMGKFLENALDNNNPLSMLPVVSDVWSMFQGYDVQRADMSLISEMYKAIQRFQSDNYSPYRKMEELLGTTAKFFGLPVKNLMRDGRRAYNLFTSSVESPSSYELSTALPWADDKATAHYEELFLAMHNGDTKREEEIRGYLTDVKDKQTDAQDEGVRDRLKERFLGGSMDEAAAKTWLKTHMGYDNRKAFETVDRWRETQENKGNEEWSYSIYNDFYNAVESGKNLDKEIKQLLDLGIEAKTLAGNITTEFKPLLLELLATGKTSQAAALQAKILDAYVALGYDREKKLKDVKKWYSK